MADAAIEQLEAELQGIDAALAALGRATMPPEARVAAEKGLREQREEILSRLEALNVEGNAAFSSDGSVAVGRDHTGPIRIINDHRILVFADAMQARAMLGPILDEQEVITADLEQATADYLQNLVDRYRYLDFRGMGVSDRVPLRLPLLQMYVPLKARSELPDGGDTWARDRRRLRLAGRELSPEEIESVGGRLGAPKPLTNLLSKTDGLIILGDPGAGKTTFLKYLALALATGQGEAMGLDQRLPILLPLSGYANALEEESGLSLGDYIVRFYRERGIELPVDDLLHRALAKGGVMLLLDGLDEVKVLERRRAVVERVIGFFSYHRKAGNKFVITSRIVGYPEVRPNVAGLAESTLVDFDDEEIETFIGQWTLALEQAARGANIVAERQAEREREELLHAVRHNEGVRRLAANPLLLTILALMKRQGIDLPEKRVELYDTYVKTLLNHWNLARGLEGKGGVSLNVRETLKVLAPLALWMHRTSPGVGLVKEQGLRDELERIYRERKAADPEAAAEGFLHDLRAHSGLLLDRGARQYGFIHLTFQEYLAAIAVAQKGQEEVRPVVDELVAHLGDDKWHEVSLLGIGYLAIVQQRDEAAGTLLELLSAHSEPAGEGAILAGEALSDIGSEAVPSDSVSVVQQALLQTLRDDERLEPKRRAEVGVLLSRVGDPRPEVTEIDAMQFCWVPAGPFMLGESDTSCRYEVEHPYWIGRFPVTVAQFRQYMELAGMKPGGPKASGDSDNHPVHRVSGYEAVAFCKWLEERWRTEKRLPVGWRLTLPSEVEWEKASRGGLQVPEGPVIELLSGCQPRVVLKSNPHWLRVFPWGDDDDLNRANIGGNVGGPSAVGAFPGGVSLYGCEEMSGNLFEWARSLYNVDPYPKGAARESHERLDGEKARVLRGGAFADGPGLGRCAYRRGSSPDFRYYNVGFRVAASPFSER